jgi:hypothetical protein
VGCGFGGCRFCGRPTEIVLDGMPICEECYQKAGSCCVEFGGQDLWRQREHDASDDPRPGGQSSPA